MKCPLSLITPHEQLAISLDVETMGFNVTACLTEIGAVVFDVNTGETFEEFHTCVDIRDAVKNGGKIDAEVVHWWAERGYYYPCNFVDMSVALSGLHAFILAKRNFEIWGKHILFDLGILETLFLKNNMSVPWKYNKPRDLATFDSFFSKKSLYGEMEPTHNALQDAISQAASVARIYEFFSVK